MKFYKLSLLTLFILYPAFFLFAQDTLTYSLDSDKKVHYNITYYDCFNDVLGGDSIRLVKNKPYNGWVKDHYEDGQLIHNGLYVKGKLTTYKNYYENGNLERAFVKKDSKKSKLEIYYENGNLQTEALFFFSNPLKWVDYYTDGSLESIEEYNNSLDYYVQHKFYYPDGKPHIILDLIDKKTKTYNYIECYESGEIMEEGQKIYNKTTGDYPRTGIWKIYDENGKLVRKEKYEKGILIDEELF